MVKILKLFACRISIGRMHDQLEEEPAAVLHKEALLSSLQAPRPDVRPRCKAMIGQCQAMTIWMAANVAAMVRLVQPGSGDKLSTQGLAGEVRLFLAS